VGREDPIDLYDNLSLKIEFDYAAYVGHLDGKWETTFLIRVFLDISHSEILTLNDWSFYWDGIFLKCNEKVQR